jgi:hypothetical protein
VQNICGIGKHLRGTKLGLMGQAKAWIQVSAAQHRRVSNNVYSLRLLRERTYLETIMMRLS